MPYTEYTERIDDLGTDLPEHFKVLLEILNKILSEIRNLNSP